MIITIFGRIGDSWHIPPSFFAVALQKGREDRNADKRVNIADDRSTSGKNLTNFGPVMLECTARVCAPKRRNKRPGGLVLKFATRF